MIVFERENFRLPSSTIKLYITDVNKTERIKFWLSIVVRADDGYAFHDILDIVHVAENCFYLTNFKKTYHLTPKEPVPLRTCKSNRIIEKASLLAAATRPRYDHLTQTMFDAEIGIWPFVVEEPAKRCSRNREKRTLVTKPITINKATCSHYLIDKVIPAIKAKWPRRTVSGPVYIQQDTVRPHMSPNDEKFFAAAQSELFDIRLRCRSPTSSDMNVLVVGFSNAI